MDGVDVDIVRSDSDDGAYQITKHLLSLGHLRIAMLAGPKSVSTSKDRVNGYRRAIRDAGLSENDEQIFWGKYTQEFGYQMAQQMLTEHSDMTALVAANNFIAIGAMHMLNEKKLRVPENIAIVSVDDIPPAFMITPFFTVAT